MNIEVTKVFLGKGKNGHLGTAVILFGDAVEVKCGLFSTYGDENNIRVSLPSRKVGEKWYNDVYITSDKLREVMQSTVIEAYKNELAQDSKSTSRDAGKQMASESVKVSQNEPTVAADEDIPF